LPSVVMQKIKDEGNDWVLAGAKNLAELIGWSCLYLLGAGSSFPAFSFFFCGSCHPMFASPLLIYGKRFFCPFKKNILFYIFSQILQSMPMNKRKIHGN
jgi:hypothetical protein